MDAVSERVTGQGTHAQWYPVGEESLGGTEDGGREQQYGGLTLRWYIACTSMVLRVYPDINSSILIRLYFSLLRDEQIRQKRG